jgi:hypothetical protein
VPYALKIAIAAVLHAGLLIWLFLPRERSGEDLP